MEVKQTGRVGAFGDINAKGNGAGYFIVFPNLVVMPDNVSLFTAFGEYGIFKISQ
jgi:hypothetical protein